MKNFFIKLFVFIFILSELCFVINEVNARAGGGSSSRSSSSSSSSRSYSTSSYGGSSFHSSSGTNTGSSSISFILIIVVIIVIFMAASGKIKTTNNIGNNNSNYEENYNDEELPEEVSDLDSKIVKLKEIDTGFNEQIFIDRVSTAFFKIQDAWCKRDMNLARAFITDSVLRRFNMQLEEYRSNNTFNKLEGLALDDTKILDINIDSVIERIDVLITATAKDYVINEKGEYVSGDKDERVTWDEKWIFIRTAGVKTNTEKTVFSEKCPSCGAPLKINSTGECEYCKSQITTGKFDWVLSEIEQLN